METRRLGDQGLQVASEGLGCMGMSEFYGEVDEGAAIATIHRALELGVTLLDTADIYGPFINEATGRPRHRRPPGRGRARHQVRQRARRGRRAGSASTAARVRARRLRRVAGAPRHRRSSTSTTSTAWTARPSRRRSAPWPNSSGRQGAVPGAVGGQRRDHPARPRRPPHRPPCSPSTPCGRATPRPRSWRRCRELGIGFVAYSPLGRGFLTRQISVGGGRPGGERLSRQSLPALPGRQLPPQYGHRRAARSDRCREGRDRWTTRLGLGAGTRATTSSPSPGPNVSTTSSRTSPQPLFA